MGAGRRKGRRYAALDQKRTFAVQQPTSAKLPGANSIPSCPVISGEQRVNRCLEYIPCLPSVLRRDHAQQLGQRLKPPDRLFAQVYADSPFQE